MLKTRYVQLHPVKRNVSCTVDASFLAFNFFSFYYYYYKRWCLSRAGKLKPKNLGGWFSKSFRFGVGGGRWTGREPAPKRILSYGVAKRHRWLHPLDPFLEPQIVVVWFYQTRKPLVVDRMYHQSSKHQARFHLFTILQKNRKLKIKILHADRTSYIVSFVQETKQAYCTMHRHAHTCTQSPRDMGLFC